jgi:hypothetical protein
MAPTVGWVYDLGKENLTKLCERYRVDATSPLAELRDRFVPFLRTQEEQEISANHMEVIGPGYPVDVKWAEVQIGDLPSADGLIPMESHTRPVDMGSSESTRYVLHPQHSYACGVGFG